MFIISTCFVQAETELLPNCSVSCYILLQSEREKMPQAKYKPVTRFCCVVEMIFKRVVVVASKYLYTKIGSSHFVMLSLNTKLKRSYIYLIHICQWVCRFGFFSPNERKWDSISFTSWVGKLYIQSGCLTCAHPKRSRVCISGAATDIL